MSLPRVQLTYVLTHPPAELRVPSYLNRPEDVWAGVFTVQDFWRGFVINAFAYPPSAIIRWYEVNLDWMICYAEGDVPTFRMTTPNSRRRNLPAYVVTPYSCDCQASTSLCKHALAHALLTERVLVGGATARRVGAEVRERMEVAG